MSEKVLSYYLALNWVPKTEQLADGSWRLTIPPLTDFEYFAPTQPEVIKDWEAALRTHLRAYLEFQKRIPMPPLPRSVQRSPGPGIFVFGDQGLVTT